MDRARSMLERDKNHAAVLIWSCGNESYAGEDILAMTQFFHAKEMCIRDSSQTASSASLASQRSRKESKHGRSVATGNPPPNPTGPATNPCEDVGA